MNRGKVLEFLKTLFPECRVVFEGRGVKVYCQSAGWIIGRGGERLNSLGKLLKRIDSSIESVEVNGYRWTP